MKVTAHNHDEVSARLTVTIDRVDYKDKVEKQLLNYAKNATIPGFRKGKVPLGMIKRQYEAPIAFEEINKQISEALNQYVEDNKLRLVGQPVPQPTSDFDHNKEQSSVDFEVGFEPAFTIDLAKYEAPHYKVESGDKEVNQSIENMQKRFATQVPQDKIDKDSFVALEISQIVEVDAEGEHNHAPKQVTISAENKEAFKLVNALEKTGTVKISKEDLVNTEVLATQLGYSKAEAEHLHHNELEVKVTDFYGLNNHEINQELFDKVYGKDTITSEEELKTRVKTELDDYFQQNADVHFVNKVLEQIVEKEEVKLPESFLVQWLMFSNQNIQSEAQAQEVLNAEKNAIKYQIIEGKLLNDNDIKLDYTDILGQAEQLVKNQLAIYGIHHLGDDEIQKYAVEMLKDQEQVRQISSEVAMAKLKDVILDKATKKATKVSHDEFLEELKK